MILCCRCGIEIEPNARNMCERCLNNMIDVSAKIMTSMHVETCRGCERYHTPPRSWKTLAWGSKDLLIFLLSRNKTIRKLNIIDSNFIYTEQHSKKICIEILVLEEGIEQACEIEFNIRNKQCSDCMHAEAKQYWKAVVQVRQKPSHRRTFLYIEQLILNHKAHLNTSNIKERKDGIDFYFLDRADAVKLVDFLSSFYGIRTTNSHQLISEDVRNNTCNKKFAFSVELLPFCKDDLVYVSNKSLNIGDFVLVSKVGNSILFYDPQTAKTIKLVAKHYFGNESQYRIVVRSERFRKYRVIYTRHVAGGMNEATVTEDDVVFYEVSTFLPIKDNDFVMGYNLVNANLCMDIDINMEVLLVRIFNDDQKNWTLKSDRLLDTEFKYFMDDISKDKSMLSSLAIYDHKNKLIEDVSKIHL